MSERVTGSNGDSPSRVEALLADYVERLNAGEPIDIESINYLGFHHIPPGAEMKAEIEEVA